MVDHALRNYWNLMITPDPVFGLLIFEEVYRILWLD
jgi:hypothetical protein